MSGSLNIIEYKLDNYIHVYTIFHYELVYNDVVDTDTFLRES